MKHPRTSPRSNHYCTCIWRVKGKELFLEEWVEVVEIVDSSLFCFILFCFRALSDFIKSSFHVTKGCWTFSPSLAVSWMVALESPLVGRSDSNDHNSHRKQYNHHYHPTRRWFAVCHIHALRSGWSFSPVLPTRLARSSVMSTTFWHSYYLFLEQLKHFPGIDGAEWNWCSTSLYFLSPVSSYCLPLAKPNQKPAGTPWSYGPHRSDSLGTEQVEKGRKWIWGDKQKKPVTQSLGHWPPAVRWTRKVRAGNIRPALYLQGQDLKWGKFPKYRKGVTVLLGRHKQDNCPLWIPSIESISKITDIFKQ